MKSVDFLYGERTLSSFGCMICQFGGSNGLNVVSNGAEITFNSIPTLNGQKYELASTQYESCLEATIQICKCSCGSDIQEITPVEFRELTKWLNRRKFIKFKLLEESYIDLYYEVSFNISRIEIDGRLFGLELQAVTNRPFALKESETINIQIRKRYVWEKYYIVNGNEKGGSTGKFVTSYNRNFYPNDGVKNNYYYVYVDERLENTASINDSSHEEGYIYPHTEIIVNESGNLNIHNAMENRDTIIKNCVAGEVITMDYPVIQSSVSSHNIQNDFNWNFFRVANTYENSRNDLTVSLPCSIKVKYSPIVKVGL